MERLDPFMANRLPNQWLACHIAEDAKKFKEDTDVEKAVETLHANAVKVVFKERKLDHVYQEAEAKANSKSPNAVWSDSQASPSASSEPMYSMPLHAPSQNTAPAYDLHSYFEPQERSFYDPFGRPLATHVVYAHGAVGRSAAAPTRPPCAAAVE
jgi:hypothetical protein